MVPQDWLSSTTAMLYKKGSKADPANYRTISLLNSPLKIFTQMIKIDCINGRRTVEFYLEAKPSLEKLDPATKIFSP